jgi:hypothetical protein
MQEKLEELRKNTFVELSSWGGLGPMPGNSGTIITNDNKIYYYHDYFRVPVDMEDRITKQEISEGKEVDQETINKLKEYIEKNLVGKEFPDQRIFDASFHVTINYNNQKIEIHNYTEIYSDLYKIIEKK